MSTVDDTTQETRALQWSSHVNDKVKDKVKPFEYAQHVPLQYPGVEEESKAQVAQCLAFFRVRQNWGQNYNTHTLSSDIASFMYAPQPQPPPHDDKTHKSFPENVPTAFNMVYGLAGDTHMIVSTDADTAADTSSNVLVFLYEKNEKKYYALRYALKGDQYSLEVTSAGDAGDQVTVTPTPSDDWPGKMLHAKWVPKHSPVWTQFNTNTDLTLDQEKTYWVKKTRKQ